MANEVLRAEFSGSLMGVPGRFMNVIGERGAPVVRNQQFLTFTRPAKGWGKGATISATVRFDDEHKNGHNTFAITGEIRDPKERRDNGIVACGCLHEEIAKAFPELAPLIKWHLTSADGPLHYIANTIYHAGDRDHNGKRAGEPWAWDDAVQFGDVPMRHKVKNGLLGFLREVATYDREGKVQALAVIAVAHGETSASGYKFGPKYQFAGQPPLKWHECPFDTEDGAERFAASFIDHNPTFHRIPTLFSEGKARELGHARSSAVWPDATDADLMQEPGALRAALMARHPALMAEFRAAMDACGFMWDAANETPPPAEWNGATARQRVGGTIGT